jgi:hypothetical protein
MTEKILLNAQTLKKAPYYPQTLVKKEVNKYAYAIHRKDTKP